jgi:hypothetical protein
MKSRSEVFAGITTFVYLAGVGVLVYAKMDTVGDMKLNEIGDFLAGVFGPIAFFWLVLGYLQQGRELRLSSEALQLQARELNASVIQQAALVEAQNVAQQSQERLLEPLLEVLFRDNSQFVDNGAKRELDTFSIINRGKFCEHVFAKILVDDKGETVYRLKPLATESVVQIDVVDIIEPNKICELRIYYTKTSGLENFQSFSLLKFCTVVGTTVQVTKLPF